MSQISPGQSFIRSLAKGLEVLCTFTHQRPVLTLSEVARLNRMNLVTARRYLMTLVQLGYVVRDQAQRGYQLTPKVLRLGSWVIGHMDLKSRLMPYMRRLTQQYNVTTGCGILEGREIVYLERLRSDDVVNLDLTAGSRLPVYCSSLGKAILAFLPPQQYRDLVERIEFVAHTPYTLRNPRELDRDLELTRERGFAVADQELSLGLKTMAVPIFDQQGGVEGAFYVSYPCQRDQKEGLDQLLIKEILAIGQTVSGSDRAAHFALPPASAGSHATTS